ncbi:hypothetical protein [Peribacillus deserti]|uniref:Uracil-DNA glycosylase-like domain-containing protein n=1 Tax=Peribacillus deserti TaxID=673318 RepID=A0A2N5M8P6_9BACI|nr:hypothetical protein [Peribacillus deserti]PLT30729.1 hypothetical protein CUU66_06125 [Peribacillus deserti]
MCAFESLATFLPYIKSLPNRKLDKSDLLIPDFLLDKSGSLDIYYAPHNEYINKQARIVIAGITPGWNQMRLAFEQARVCLDQGTSLANLSYEVKKAARFAGSMRKNLIHMLDLCGIPEALGIQSSQQLFSDHGRLLHTTSIIKYPVFSNGKNYTGHAPAIERSPLLKRYAYEVFPQEINQLENSYLLIPLGKGVSDCVRNLIDQECICPVPCLWDFPHPSGANGHRHKQFADLKSNFKSVVSDFACNHLT